MKAGQPTKYKPEYIKTALDFVGGGKSITQLARHLMVSRDTIYAWSDTHPEFSDALKIAKDWGQSVWEDKLEEMMYDKEVNTRLVKLYFANRFKWHDRPAEEQQEQKAIKIEIVNPYGSDPTN